MQLHRWPSSGGEISLSAGHTSTSCDPSQVKIYFRRASGLTGYGDRSSEYRVTIHKHEFIDLVHEAGLFRELAEHPNEVIITRIGLTNHWLRTEFDDYGTVISAGWIEPVKALEYKP